MVFEGIYSRVAIGLLEYKVECSIPDKDSPFLNVLVDFIQVRTGFPVNLNVVEVKGVYDLSRDRVLKLYNRDPRKNNQNYNLNYYTSRKHGRKEPQPKSAAVLLTTLICSRLATADFSFLIYDCNFRNFRACNIPLERS